MNVAAGPGIAGPVEEEAARRVRIYVLRGIGRHGVTLLEDIAKRKNGGTVNVGATVDLEVSGDATIAFEGLLSVAGSFTLIQQDANTTVFGAGAKALSLSLTAASESPVGGASGSLELIRVSNGNQSWLGVAASDLAFSFDFAPVSLAVTNGTLTLNQATNADRIDPSQSTFPAP